MKQAVIRRDALTNFIRSVGKDCRVYAPVREENTVNLAEISSSGEIELAYANSRVPLKNLFFPQSEVICTFVDGEALNVQLPDENAVILGSRPCDARALPILDKVFSEDIGDPYYLARRNNALIITLACNDPSETCFCTSLGGSPSGKEGSDILAFDLGEVLLFETVSEKGGSFMETYSGLFQPANKAHLKTKKDLASTAEKKVPALDVEGVSEKLEGAFDSPFWDKIHQTCLACGICTFLCPTCHCFAFDDSRVDSKGERVRLWDCCQYPAFTMEASGHNPRISSRERMRQRIMHKFSYYVKNFGEVACVGCGRCVENCPINLDLREIVTIIKEES